MQQQSSPQRVVKQVTGEERKNEFFFHFQQNQFWQLNELAREDIHFGKLDLHTLREQVVQDMNEEIHRQIQTHQSSEKNALPEYRLKDQVPKWIPSNLGIKTIQIEQEGLKENIAAQIDSNLQNFFQFNPEISKVFGYEIIGNEIKIYFQYHQLTLEEDILQRIQEKRPFQEELLWKMLYNLIRASSILHKNNQSLVDIRPSRVYYNNYQASLVPYGIFPDQDLSLLDKLNGKQHNVQFSPEQEKEFQSGVIENVDNFFENNFKYESYQIGMTILMAGLMLPNQNPAYDYQNRIINQEELKNMLQEFTKRYSNSESEKLLSFTLHLLLQKDPILRITTSDLIQILEPFQFNILFLQNFQDFKTKLHQVYIEKFSNYSFFLTSNISIL